MNRARYLFCGLLCLLLLLATGWMFRQSVTNQDPIYGLGFSALQLLLSVRACWVFFGETWEHGMHVPAQHWDRILMAILVAMSLFWLPVLISILLLF